MNRQGIFPDFLKIITISDSALAELLKKKVEEKLPYVVVVTKRDDDNYTDVVDSTEQIYNVGTLCQIAELKEYSSMLKSAEMGTKITTDKNDDSKEEQDGKKILQLLVHGIRRTAILGDTKVNESGDDSAYAAACRDQADDKRLLMAHVQQYQVQQKLKEGANIDSHRALCQEIITTIRDMITMNPIHRETIASIKSFF